MDSPLQWGQLWKCTCNPRRLCSSSKESSLTNPEIKKRWQAGKVAVCFPCFYSLPSLVPKSSKKQNQYLFCVPCAISKISTRLTPHLVRDKKNKKVNQGKGLRLKLNSLVAAHTLSEHRVSSHLLSKSATHSAGTGINSAVIKPRPLSKCKQRQSLS